MKDMSDEGRLGINFVALHNASTHIQSAIATLDQQLDGLEKDAAPLVASWSGEAREAYQVRQANWRKASAECTDILRRMLRALDESRADYARMERHNTGLFQ
jgi:WXG100 family type VII secretion target